MTPRANKWWSDLAAMRLAATPPPRRTYLLACRFVLQFRVLLSIRFRQELAWQSEKRPAARGFPHAVGGWTSRLHEPHGGALNLDARNPAPAPGVPVRKALDSILDLPTRIALTMARTSGELVIGDIKDIATLLFAAADAH